MTIRKGADWGRLGPVPEALVVVGSNAELFRLLNAGATPGAVGLAGGDLFRTLGGSPDVNRLANAAEVLNAPVDLGVAHHDGGTHRFAAHAVARRSWWRGRVVGAFNAQYRGRWDVAPRSHPNDGLLDVVEVSADMDVGQRWGARSRLPTGLHVPHPAISTRRANSAEWTFARPVRLYLDGVAVGDTTTLRVEVVKNALTVCL